MFSLLNFNTRSTILRTLITCALSFPAIAMADQAALDFTSLGSGFDYRQGTYSLGWSFTANQDVTVTSLGFYDDLKNGLNESHVVGIYDAETCGLVTSTTVEPSDPLSGFFRFREITPVTLTSGKNYYAAAVTGLDKYAISVTDLIVDPAITFLGFAIYGNTESTSTLRCPNGPASQLGFHGDFGPTFKIGNATDPESGKRATAISLFCNRTGVNLGTAVCSATVADIGAPPRNLPTGSIDFVASEGFFPANASCLVQQTPFSPGIGSCQVEFAVPVGFGIGNPFPIEATYGGATGFKASTTSHQLIKPGCVGDQNNPCSGDVALSFSNSMRIVKNKISQIVLACKKAAGAKSLTNKAEAPVNACLSETQVSLNIAEELQKLTAEQIKLLGQSIKASEAKDDLTLAKIQALSKLTTEKIELLRTTQGKLQEAINGSIKNIKSGTKKAALSKNIISFGKTSKTVRSDKQGVLTISAEKRMRTFLDVLRRANVTDSVTLSVQTTVRRQLKKGKRGKAIKITTQAQTFLD